MKRETVRKMGGFALAAVLAASSVQPVLAEEANPEVQNTEAEVQTAEEENAADVQRAEKKKPSVTVDSVDWNSGVLKVPVDLGEYSAEEVTITFSKDGITSLAKYDGKNAVYNLTYDVVKGDEWHTKAGTYELKVSFSGKNNETLASEKVTVQISKDSVRWQVKEENYEFDGSQDITFSFKNGTNLLEMQSIKELSIFTGMGAAGDPSVSVPNMTEGFAWDKESGTFTINKDALGKALASGKSYNGGVLPDKIAINVHAVTPEGQDVYNINQIPYTGEDEHFQTTTAWWLDISKWKAAQNETPNESEMSFGDVSTDHWYYDYVKYVYDRGLMTGLNENDFGAVQSLARAQFAVILYRMEGEPEVEYKDVFPDVADGQWYTDAIMWANQAGIVTGYTDSGLFGFADDINREQMAVMMHRYAEYKGFDISKKADFGAFSDAANVNEFADEAMQWAVGTGIISGKDEGTRIDPQGDAARAECATIIQRFVTAYGM